MTERKKAEIGGQRGIKPLIRQDKARPSMAVEYTADHSKSTE